MTDTTGFVTPPPVEPPTVEGYLLEIAEFRARDTDMTKTLGFLGDKMAEHLVKKMPDQDKEQLGLAIVQAASAATALVAQRMSAASVINVLLLAGEQMVAEARAAQSEVSHG